MKRKAKNVILDHILNKRAQKKVMTQVIANSND
jgi:hypothetical protein